MNHDGHRQRIRKKFISAAPLEDHEILEIVLFASIPRCNTNELAHELINHCGSFRGVFDADIETLQEIEGIGPSSALQIRLISECIARYFQQAQDTRTLLSNRTALEEYLRSLFIGCNYEKALVLFFNASGRLISTHELGKGSVNLVHLSPREILTLATQANASSALLVHNHPDGVLFPSDKDLAATIQIEETLRSIHVDFIDHFIVANNQCRPILYHRNKNEDATP